jgi:hypothetical protein
MMVHTAILCGFVAFALLTTTLRAEAFFDSTRIIVAVFVSVFVSVFRAPGFPAAADLWQVGAGMRDKY